MHVRPKPSCQEGRTKAAVPGGRGKGARAGVEARQVGVGDVAEGPWPAARRSVASELRPVATGRYEVDAFVCQTPGRRTEGGQVLAGGSARHREDVGLGQTERRS